MPALALAVLVTAALLLAVLAATRAASRRAAARDLFQRLDGYRTADLRAHELAAPVGERVLGPLSRGLSRVAGRLSPQGHRDSVQRRLTIGGNPGRLSVDQVLTLQLLGICSLVLWVPAVLWVLRVPGALALLVIGLAWIGSVVATDVWLTRAVQDRQRRIAVALPDVLDLLVISVEAGLGFEQALDRTTEAVPGPLSDEFRRMLRETRIGSSRAEALRALDARCEVPELRTFILAMLQADTFGVSISRLLRTQADEMRTRRRLRAQAQAQRAPVKMLFPLVFCIFPAIFVVILGPAILQFSTAFSA